MAKQKGRTLLVKIGDGASPETFDTLCSLTTKGITLNHTEIDVTTPDCDTPGGPMWTEVLDGARRMEVTGSGFSKKVDAETRLATIVTQDAGPYVNAQIVVPNFGTFEGQFFVSATTFNGDSDGSVAFDLSMASSGEVTFTAESA